jgi:hypothetical protein
MFNTSAGLLLNHNLHKTFDTLNWSLYRKVSLLRSIQCISKGLLTFDGQDETYYVHYFSPRDLADFQLHGKAISPDRFSRFYDSPDPRLVAWHYSQAVKARIRGFSVARMETKASKP